MRSEFLAVPQLLRFDYASGSGGQRHPVLLVKASSLLLKYVVVGVPMRLSVSWLGEGLLYALTIFDDADHPATLWSVMETDIEREALLALAEGELCGIALFNELATNVAFGDRAFASVPAILADLVRGATLTTPPGGPDVPSSLLDELARGELGSDAVALDIRGPHQWQQMKNLYVTANAESSEVDLFDRDEGGQQEQLAIWLADSLLISRAYLRPQIPRGRHSRELTDILLCHEHGSTLIESKALSILTRDALPSIAKLSSDASKHVIKAVRQLRGGIRSVKAGVHVTTERGETIDIERDQPIHAIVLVPELSLIRGEGYGASLLSEFQSETGGFIHLLDPAELLRIVQTAEMIAERHALTRIIAFDHYLEERTKFALDADELCIEVLLRVEDG